MPSTTNAEFLDSWVLALHDKADRTRRQYRDRVDYFADWLAGTDRTHDLLAVRRQDIEAWFSAQAADGIKQNTRRSRWIALRSFYGWLLDEEEIDASPMERVKVAKADEPAPAVLDLDDLKALLKACEGKRFLDRRDTALVRTFLATGGRLNEITSLQLSDIDLSTRIVHVMGKGSKPRVARFDAPTAAAIDRYRRARSRHRCAAEPWLWLGSKGQLTDSGITYALQQRATAAGLTGFHPHLLRHTWADLWKSKGGSEGDLMKLGGWQDASVMRRYAESRAVDRALAAYDQIDPMGGL